MPLKENRPAAPTMFLDELSGEEAAQTLGLTADHVAVLLHRARKQLEQCMQGA